MTTPNTTPSAEERILKKFTNIPFPINGGQQEYYDKIYEFIEKSLKSYKKEILKEVEKRVIVLPALKNSIGYGKCLQDVLDLLNSLK